MARTHYPVDAAHVMRELSRADRLLAQVIRRIGSFPTKKRKPQHPFASLLQTIVYQQLAGKAAEAIFGRVKALGANGFPTPEEILQASDEQLRAKTVDFRERLKPVVEALERGLRISDDPQEPGPGDTDVDADAEAGADATPASD